MGAISDAVWAYAQPLLDDTDGSDEDLNWALSLSQLCWNLALLSKEKREQSIEEMRPMLLEAGADFEEFRTSVLGPMIQRHEEMFPRLHRSHNVSSLGPHGSAGRIETYPGTDPYAPCPCHSGRKYKFCCRGKT
jgi:SEC-C motif